MSFWIDVPEEENGNITYNEVVALMNAHESAVSEEIEDFETETRANLQTLSVDLNAEANTRNSHDTQLQSAIDTNNNNIVSLQGRVSGLENTVSDLPNRVSSLENSWKTCNGSVNLSTPYMLSDTYATGKVYIPSGSSPLTWHVCDNGNSAMFSFDENTGCVTCNKTGYVVVSGQVYVGCDVTSTSFTDYTYVFAKVNRTLDGTNWTNIGNKSGVCHVGNSSMRNVIPLTARVVYVTAGSKLNFEIETDDVSRLPFIGNDWQPYGSRMELFYISYDD